MPQTHLHQTLKALQEQLGKSPEVGAEDRALLTTVLADVQHTLDHGKPHEPAVVERLEGATVSFEVKHPELAAVARQLADLLRRAGV